MTEKARILKRLKRILKECEEIVDEVLDWNESLPDDVEPISIDEMFVLWNRACRSMIRLESL